MEHLITDIEDRLRAEVPQLETIDEDYGQLQKMFEEGEEADIYPVISPAVFVNVGDIGWSNLSAGSQTGAVSVVIALAIDCYDDTHQTTEQRLKTADRMALMERVHWALQDWRPSGATPLVRVQTRLFHLPHLWKVYETTYRTSVCDIDQRTHATTTDALRLRYMKSGKSEP